MKVCPHCNGRGWINDGEDCPDCNGSGQVGDDRNQHRYGNRTAMT
jgi:DnaJ-class molecular chaperone